jgi:hypothetical protein
MFFMKRTSLFIFCISTSILTLAQSFPGYNTSNYSGVNGVFFNPANVTGSKFKWNVNLFSLNAGIANNNASFSLKNIASTFGDDVDSLLFGDSKKNTSGLVNMDIQGPSFMLDVSKKSSIAFTSRIRVMANVADLDGQFIQSINDNLSSSTFPITLQSTKNQKVIVNGWTDWGLTFGHVFLDKGPHFFKAGVTAKYLAGATNNYANIDNLNGTLNKNLAGDVYLTNASGKVAIGVAGIDFSDDDADFTDAINFKSSGFGADLGFVYEFRPGNKDAYKLKAGVAILDIGSVKYTTDLNQSGSYTVNIPAGTQWYPEDLDDKSLSEIKDYLDASPYFTNNGTSSEKYKVSLPTRLQVNVDYAAAKNFFVNLGGHINLVPKSNVYSSFYYNSFMLTPRFENKVFGVYLPLSYNELSGFNAGFSFRVGPVFFGSGAIINAAMDKSKQADFYFGVRFGGLKKK